MKTIEIATFLGAELVGNAGLEITGIADLRLASISELAFVDHATELKGSSAGLLIVPCELEIGTEYTFIRVPTPKLAFARVAAEFYRSDAYFSGARYTDVADSARVSTDRIGAFVSIGENSVIGENCSIGDGVRIGRNVTLGERTVIHQNCVIYDRVSIGAGCIIHAGTVIGADGFGYVKNEVGEYIKFPQIGTVVVEDNVEIGANSCVDRGALGETRIGEGTKIDNLVQIAHNVRIGKRVVIAAQTGISGSSIVEDDCVIGGQVGLGDHVKVLSGSVIGSQAGVLPGKIVRPGVWWGTPIQPLDEYKRQNAHVKGIGRLKDDFKRLKLSVEELIKGKRD
ncbi:MAG: UDP-3-O-(3-hydroxymyristoyl)glucosamine N-acyltransferase [Pyrinomonadaceae bacterium]|nr:UDP-3-O-(3-hydroxymyristoyl)glucosamine N-acyltransferase [Pyrinomonadaceae bacterium]MBP6214498.1 UDP-3-O-(3-hydroxymyristoyl)glucosamine N-acyltransferase [Pyrinomonadaceae bacterium]